MTDAEMRGLDMQDTPERIWTAGGHCWPDPTFKNDKTRYTRTDLCVTEAECQRRIDAAVMAEREACAKDCDKIAGNTSDFSGYIRHTAGMCAAAIRARGQK